MISLFKFFETYFYIDSVDRRIGLQNWKFEIVVIKLFEFRIKNKQV